MYMIPTPGKVLQLLQVQHTEGRAGLCLFVCVVKVQRHSKTFIGACEGVWWTHFRLFSCQLLDTGCGHGVTLWKPTNAL